MGKHHWKKAWRWGTKRQRAAFSHLWSNSMYIQWISSDSVGYTCLITARYCGMWTEVENSVFPQPCQLCNAALGRRKQEAAYPTLLVMEMLTVIPWPRQTPVCPACSTCLHIWAYLLFFTNLVNYFLFTFKTNSFVLSLHLKLQYIWKLFR